MNSIIPDNGHVINKLVKLKNFILGAELGVRRGEFSSSLLFHNPDLKMICVDLWATHESFNEDHPHEDNFYKYLNNIEGMEGRTITIKKLTTDAVLEVEDDSVDFIFLDATHTYDALKKDITAWLPKVKIGGLISGHDYHPHFDGGGIIKLVNETFGVPQIDLPTGDFNFNFHTEQITDWLMSNEGLAVDRKTTCWYKWKNL